MALVGIALLMSGCESSPEDPKPTLADLVASRSTEGDPGESTSVDLDYCSPPLPGILDDGSLSPELATFPARVLDRDFQFLGLRLGLKCGQEAGGLKVLQTRWRHVDSGQEIWVSQSEGETPVARISTLYTAFSDGGFDFNVAVFPSPRLEVSSDEQRKILLTAMAELGNQRDLKCFYENEPRDWNDLAALGIGDPRPAIPSSLSVFRLEFSMLREPDEGCPSLPRIDSEPEMQFTAMLRDGNDLLSLHIRSTVAQEPPSKFEPGTTNWSNADYAFSIVWHPEHHSDDDIRRIARALDPSFDAVCKLESSEASVDELGKWQVNQPAFPATVSKPLAVQVSTVHGSPGCSPADSGFYAHWMVESTDPVGIIEVLVRAGPQTQPYLTYYGEDSSIYWKRADGTEFVVSGIKSHFERSALLAIARSIDIDFDESQLTTPPSP
ncbi:MAG: hypothetical protein AB7N24_11140 [Dehalococcoidia bacterium]